jgi:hypothetical protein
VCHSHSFAKIAKIERCQIIFPEICAVYDTVDMFECLMHKLNHKEEQL